MKKMQSLTTRLVLYLLFAQFVGAFLPWRVVAYISSVAERYGGADAMLQIYTYFHIQDLVADSLETSPDGAVRLRAHRKIEAPGRSGCRCALRGNGGELGPNWRPDPRQSFIRSSSRRNTTTARVSLSYGDWSGRRKMGRRDLGADAERSRLYRGERNSDFTGWTSSTSLFGTSSTRRSLSSSAGSRPAPSCSWGCGRPSARCGGRLWRPSKSISFRWGKASPRRMCRPRSRRWSGR